MVADPLSDAADTTMPRQRAIIAWDGAEQRLAIDTAFTGEAAEFAWLVPLPSEPEITPATKGMFDTAAVLTAPRLKRSSAGKLLFGGVLLILASLGMMTLRSSIARIALLSVIGCFGLVLGLPVMGTARGSAGPPSTVEVLSVGHAGLYETAVLRSKDAEELLAWLRSGGYGVQDGVADVVQDYLDKGWVFAAAKLTVDDADASEHRAHPLQFRFATDVPVYPMALTAVGNREIDLELFVFADGSASGKGLSRRCSLETKPDTRDADDSDARFMLRERPIAIAHPGLIEIAGGLGSLTRLTGVLSPAQQRDDIVIKIEPFAEHDPGFYVPGTGIEHGVGVGLIVAGALGLVLAMFTVDASEARDALWRQQRRAIALMALAGMGAGAGVAIATPEYRGKTTSGRTGIVAENILRSLGEHLPAIADIDGPANVQEVLELFDACAPEESISTLREGDSPLHYRLEPGETEASLWFVWHDTIGGEHRSEIPLVIDPADESG
ncbi:MAG: DUF2330 domain-containing protein [Phycisphaerales bacterium JB064]